MLKNLGYGLRTSVTGVIIVVSLFAGCKGEIERQCPRGQAAAITKLQKEAVGNPRIGKSACVAIVHCGNGVKDEDESGKDCGGDDCLFCTAGETCGDDADCDTTKNLACIRGTCQVPDACGNTCGTNTRCDEAIKRCVGTGANPQPQPSCTDGIQNQGEAAVDCGGPCAACAMCMSNTQCGGTKPICAAGNCRSCQNDAECGDANKMCAISGPNAGACVIRIRLYKVELSCGTQSCEGWGFSNEDALNPYNPESTHRSTNATAGITAPQLTFWVTAKQIMEHATPQDGNAANKVPGLELNARVWDNTNKRVVNDQAWYGSSGYPALNTLSVKVDGKDVPGRVNSTGWGTNWFVSVANMKAAGVMDLP